MFRLFWLLILFFPLAIHAQFTEGFNDGNFTTTPIWLGDTAKFTISDGQLRSNSSVESDIFYLSTPSDTLKNTQWNISINLKFQTSSANYTDIFLISDSANLKADNNNAYFVRIGNTKDEISLYRRLNGSDSVLIDGIDGETNSSNNSIALRVTCSENYLWTLQTKLNEPWTKYVTTGTSTDSSITNGNYFGILIKQSTPSFHYKHYYDDIYVGAIKDDTLAPYKAVYKDVIITELFPDPSPQIGLPAAEFVELYNKSTQSILLLGWKLSDGSSTATLNNYTLQPNSYLILCANADTAEFSSFGNVMGVSSFPVLNNAGDNVTLKNNLGELIDSISYLDTWYNNVAKQEGGWSLELINPSSGSNCHESLNWNASSSIIGGTPGKQNAVYSIIPDTTSPLLLYASVLTNTTLELYFNEALDGTTVNSNSTYLINNTVGSVTQASLSNNNSKAIQLVLKTPLQSGVVYSLSLNGTITDCFGNTVAPNSNVQFMLPDSANTNDVIINEILFNPKTGGVDFVEIYNRSNKIIDLKHLIIAKFDTLINAATDSKKITSSEFFMQPKEYIVLSENTNAVKSQYTTNGGRFIELTKMPALNADEGTVCIARSNTVIDWAKYHENMHFKLLNDSKGVSLERINPDRNSLDKNNWHSAAAGVGYATPGYQNSQYTVNDMSDNNPVYLSPEIFSPDEDGWQDLLTINYQFDTPGLLANISIFDSKGYLVKQLVRNEMLATQGTFIWDGLNDNSEKSKIGIHILFIEIIDLKGSVKQYKKSFVLAGKL